MRPEPEKFSPKAKKALKNPDLQDAMTANHEFACLARQAALSEPRLEEMKRHAHRIKDHVLDHLGGYLEQYEQQAVANGITVHWARTPSEARDIIRSVCQKVDARLAVCGKSMIAAEIDAPKALRDIGVERFETDLGEYILQLAGDEPPSHVNGPAIHKSEAQIRRLLHETHSRMGIQGSLTKAPEALLKDVRNILREKFLTADVGIIGANFLVAENGANVLVSNEGNADLSALLPRTNIILSSIEKVLPRVSDAEIFLSLLCLSATGQQATAYQSFYRGPAKDQNTDGPENVHVILLDNGRSGILSSRYRPILRCFRCGACMDNCPVYQVVGGHAYGWIYPGPMGVVWTSLLEGMQDTNDLANACTLNGHCSEVCPMKIPLKDMIRSLRDDHWEGRTNRLSDRIPISLWGAVATHPDFYRWAAKLAGAAGGLIPEKKIPGKIPGIGGWTVSRSFPAIKKQPFSLQWKRKGASRRK